MSPSVSVITGFDCTTHLDRSSPTSTGPKRHPVQGRALNSDIIYPVKDSRPRNPHPVRTPLGQISPGNDDNMDKYKALSSPLQSLPPPSHPLLGTFALGPSHLGTFVTWSVIDWSILRSKNKNENWSQHSILNFLLNSRHSKWQLTTETVFPRIAKISMVQYSFEHWLLKIRAMCVFF